MIRERDLVRLARRVIGEGFEFEAGAVGCVVYVWSRGRAFEVEFTDPISAVVTIDAHDLEAEPPQIGRRRA